MLFDWQGPVVRYVGDRNLTQMRLAFESYDKGIGKTFRFIFPFNVTPHALSRLPVYTADEARDVLRLLAEFTVERRWNREWKIFTQQLPLAELWKETPSREDFLLLSNFSIAKSIPPWHKIERDTDKYPKETTAALITQRVGTPKELVDDIFYAIAANKIYAAPKV